MPKRTMPAADSVGAEMIRDMRDLVDTMAAGGMPAVEGRFTIRKVVVAPPRVPTPAEIKAAREGVGASQPVFAAYLGVSAQLVKAWEQGTKTPVGAARLVLGDMGASPAHWRAKLVAAMTRTEGQPAEGPKPRKRTAVPVRKGIPVDRLAGRADNRVDARRRGDTTVNYLHKDFDLADGDVVEVTLDHPANVQLLDAANFEQYRRGKPYRYHGGHAQESPARLSAPSPGRWHLVVDLGGGVGTVRAAVRVLSAQPV